MKRAVSSVIVATVLFTAQAVLAATPLVRLYVKDSSNQEAPTEVNLRVPLSMIEAFAPQIQEGLAQAQLQDNNIDLRAMWQALQDAGPSQLISVTNAEGTVQVSTTETHLEVRVDQEQGINISIPLQLVDAVLSGDQLDMAAVTQALEAMSGQDLININGDQIEVRAWVE